MSETGSYYVETTYLPATNTKGSRVRVRMAGDRMIVETVPFNYEIGGGENQHRHAVARSCSGLIQLAYETKHGFVFAVTPIV